VARERDSSEPDRSEGDVKPANEQFDSDNIRGNFYAGLIVFLDRARGRGIIRSHSGREIRFEFPFVSVIGAALGGRAPGIDLLSEGDSVGFDVGWTSRGLRVTMIKPARPGQEID
jgi:hypothetical protein